jgi:hypothetical protein
MLFASTGDSGKGAHLACLVAGECSNLLCFAVELLFLRDHNKLAGQDVFALLKYES